MQYMQSGQYSNKITKPSLLKFQACIYDAKLKYGIKNQSSLV